MAQKVIGFIKLQIPAGKATPAPPVGPALGQHGVNIMAFTKEFNELRKFVNKRESWKKLEEYICYFKYERIYLRVNSAGTAGSRTICPIF